MRHSDRRFVRDSRISTSTVAIDPVSEQVVERYRVGTRMPSSPVRSPNRETNPPSWQEVGVSQSGSERWTLTGRERFEFMR